MHDKFEQELRKSLGDPPDYPFDESVSQNIEKKLDRKEPEAGGKRPFFWPLLALAVLVPLLLLFGLYGEYRQQAGKIAVLEQLLFQEKTLSTNTSRREVTVIYDTIYRAYRKEFDTSASFMSASNAPPSSAFYNASNFTYHQSSGIRRHPWFDSVKMLRSSDQTIFSSSGERLEKEQLGWQPTEILTPLAARPLRLLAYAIRENLPDFALPSYHKERRKASGYLSSLKPSSLAISGRVGFFHAEQLPQAAAQNNFTRTLGVEAAFGRHFRFLAGGTYLSNAFTLGEDDIDPASYPTVTPNNPDDELESIKADFRFWQFPLGGKVVLLKRHRLNPVFGLGIIGVKPQKSSLSYEFEDDNDDYYTVNQETILNRDLRFSDAWLMAGIEYDLTSQWSVLLQAQQQWSFESGTDLFANREYHRLNLGIRYNFY